MAFVVFMIVMLAEAAVRAWLYGEDFGAAMDASFFHALMAGIGAGVVSGLIGLIQSRRRP